MLNVNILKSLQFNPRETFFNLFSVLCSKQEYKNISEKEVKEKLSCINEYYKDSRLKESNNGTVISAFIYYILSTKEKLREKIRNILEDCTDKTFQ
ncbi:hypothetical protein [Helicobacter sp. 23-1045]